MSKGKRVVIIGAGVGGMCAGAYQGMRGSRVASHSAITSRFNLRAQTFRRSIVLILLIRLAWRTALMSAMFSCPDGQF